MDFIQQFDQLKENIYTDAYKLSAFEISQKELDTLVSELVAYLLVLSYSKCHTTNINRYDIEYSMHIETDPFFSSQENIESFDDSGLRDRMRTAEKFLREGQEYNYKILRDQGIRTPSPQQIQHIRQGRFYDKANLLMIDHVFLHPLCKTKEKGVAITKQSYSLFELFMHKKLKESKKVSVRKIISAYNDYDLLYEKAQSITDYKTYIDYWILLYRTEVRMHYTLINQIADYMIQHNLTEIPKATDIADLLWNPIALGGFFTESYSVLRYDEYIPILFDPSKYNDAYYYSQETRFYKHSIFCNYLEFCEKLFKPIFSSNSKEAKEAYRAIYKFCHDEYPIIESHIPINIKNNSIQGNLHKKIKLIRKIVPIVLPIEEYQKIYQGK